MHSVAFSELVSDVAEEMGWDAAMLSAEEWTSIRRGLNLAVQDFWRAYWWPETMVTQVVFYAEGFNGAAAYPYGAICYESVSNGYYQTVRDTPGGTYPPDYPHYWAHREFAETLPARYDITKAYVMTDRVHYGGFWFYCHTDAAAGVQPTDPASWGQLVPFSSVVPYVAAGRPIIGRAYRVVSVPGLDFELTTVPDGVYIQDGHRLPTPTLEYQIRSPQIVGDHWSATMAYTQERAERAIYGLR
jgi:hypothetical protein